jgi:hypothetical protein
MITCESAQNPGVRPSDQLGAAPFQTHTRGGALANRESAQGPGGWKKILKPPNPERGGDRVVLKMSISIVFEVVIMMKTLPT